MLLSLEIQNYAIIKHINIDFKKGFTSITGETGAGKSILLGALSLITGQRADTTVLNDKNKKCIVEANFNITNYKLYSFFVENNLDFDDNTIIRREIGKNGKSRAFINDTPVKLDILKQIGKRLIDIHSQHQNLKIADVDFQLSVIDILAKNTDLLHSYSSEYINYKAQEKKLFDLKERASNEKTDLDYLQFQYSQIEELCLQVDEQNTLEEELEVLTHAEEIKSNLDKSNFEISNSNNNIIEGLKEVLKSFENIKAFLPEADSLFERVNSSLIELQDIDNEIEVLSGNIEFNPARIDFLNERLSSIYTLEQKHNVDSIAALIEIKEVCLRKINEIDNFDTEIIDAEIELEKKYKILIDIAKTLTEKRTSVIPFIETNILKYLSQLGMSKTIFKVQLEPKKEVSISGNDNVLFMFSANNTSDLKPVAKVASGGELSRLMFVLKFIISQSMALPTIIFDEIDTGVSGDIADKMAIIMQKMATKMQVLSITHLPQIAAKGSYHYIVYKNGDKDITTGIKLLNKADRINEIAKMLSGSKITDAAYKNAEALLAN